MSNIVDINAALMTAFWLSSNRPLENLCVNVRTTGGVKSPSKYCAESAILSPQLQGDRESPTLMRVAEEQSLKTIKTDVVTVQSKRIQTKQNESDSLVVYHLRRGEGAVKNTNLSSLKRGRHTVDPTHPLHVQWAVWSRPYMSVWS